MRFLTGPKLTLSALSCETELKGKEEIPSCKHLRDVIVRGVRSVSLKIDEELAADIC